MIRSGVSRGIRYMWASLLYLLGDGSDGRPGSSEGFSMSDQQDRWVVKAPQSSAMSTVGGASLGTMIGSGIAIASSVFLGPGAIAVPSIITIAGAGIGAIVGYSTGSRHSTPPGMVPSASYPAK